MKPLHLSRPYLIAMVGIPGSGKSFFANHFAKTFNASIVNGELISSNAHSPEATENISNYMLEELFKSTSTIIYDKDLKRRSDRQELAKSAKKAGYETLFIWVQTDAAAAKSRFVKNRKLDKLSTIDLFENEFRKFTAPNSHEKYVVISGKHTYANQLKIVLMKLADSRPKPDMPERKENLPRHEVSRRIAIR